MNEIIMFYNLREGVSFIKKIIVLCFSKIIVDGPNMNYKAL